MIQAVAAVDLGWLIGQGGSLPWRLPEEFRHFKAVTMGRPLIMGRLTWESLPKRPLPGRLNIVLTRRRGYQAPGASVCADLESALALALEAHEDVMIIGGQQIYELAMPRVERVLLTVVHARLEGDAWFPALSAQGWRVVDRFARGADERHAYAFEVLTLDRVREHPALAQPQPWAERGQVPQAWLGPPP